MSAPRTATAPPPSAGDLSGATIAFDLDGTLVDTAPDLIGALNVVLGERGLSPAPRDAARVLVGKGARALIAHGFAMAGEPLADGEIGGLVDRFVDVYRLRVAEESRPFTGVTQALQALSQAGARLCVCTNKRTDLSLALLDALGLTDSFVSVTGADGAPRPKPDPSHFLAAIEEAGGDPSYALMVGDSDNDVRSAHAAGAPVVVVDFGYTDIPPRELGAEAVVSRFADLPAAARALLLLRRPLPGSMASAIATAS